MTRLSKGMTVAVIAAAAVVGLGTTEASASGTWTVSGGTTWKAHSTNPALKDNRSGTTLTCTAADASGTAQNGTGLSGAGLGSITGATWTSCTGPLGISFGVTSSNLPWSINGSSYNATTGVTTGTITGVVAKLSGTCNATWTAGSAGLNATYTNSTGVLAVTGGTLTASGVSGSCFGLIANGDTATYTASYTVTPKLTITSP